MRPTNLKFRSPKERTGEFLYPQIKHDGTNLELAKDKYHQSLNERFSTFSNERRFQQPNNMFVSVQTGPGSYDTQNFKTILEKINSSKRKANEPLIGKGTNLNYGYCYVDDSIVFDDTFAKLSLKKKMRRLQNYGTSQREIIDKQNQQNMRYSLKGYQDQIDNAFAPSGLNILSERNRSNLQLDKESINFNPLTQDENDKKIDINSQRLINNDLDFKPDDLNQQKLNKETLPNKKQKQIIQRVSKSKQLKIRRIQNLSEVYNSVNSLTLRSSFGLTDYDNIKKYL
eukprot:403340948